MTEVIGADLAPLKNMLTVIKAAGYEIDLAGITCSLDASVERNANRSHDNISAYYTETYHQRWILANVGS